MKLLVLNPNTTAAMTDKVVAEVPKNLTNMPPHEIEKILAGAPSNGATQ